MAPSTPSPPVTALSMNGSATSNSTSRRPPRKSTLTQQQKNQKRQRATQDQLITLEVEFNKNPTPTAAVRERIAQDISMTERSVQIWFQNRRAKIKLLAKKSIETGEDCDSIPESMRAYLAMQELQSGKPSAREFYGPLSHGPGMVNTYGGGMLLNADSSSPGKVVIHHFSCKSLSIGSWRRVGQNAMDLVVFYAPDKACLTYYINNDSAGYKIEYPFSYIKNITLENNDPINEPSGMHPKPRGLLVELNRPPNFFMDSSGTGGFHQCGDFTEDQQASRVLVHHLGGHPNTLSGQLAKLVSLESFQTRHNPFDHHATAASAPVSPVIPRPASQPNHMSHPHLAQFQENGFGMGPPSLPRGHKRTRSRSVPCAVDFSMFQTPMPSFHIQHPSTTVTDPNIFAPIPQHHNNLGPLGPNLRIDTSSGYGLDYRQYPLSAATTTSPSDFASPSFYSTGAQMDSVPAANFNPYGLPYLSPMMEHSNLIQPSVSPLSAFSSHGDPIIADQSPPMNHMHRSPSADFLTISQDHQSTLSDDGFMLSEMYSKQNLNLPMHSPAMDDTGSHLNLQEESSSEEMDLHNMVSFGTIDPSSLSPENLSHQVS
ncbi:MAG: hypothetical protein LQ350_006009 [Teloschistes chrysophthalmus]|nr:MAG: hypothetical protein LQ350_006009 [Niorma chrysophthalma]